MPVRLPALRWTTLLLAASIGLTTIGVVEASRSVRSQRAVAERALRDYAGFAAWSYQQHLREVLSRSTEEVLGAVNHGHEQHTSPQVPPVYVVPQYVEFDQRCQCHKPQYGPSPTAFIAFQLGSDTLGVALNAHDTPAEGWRVNQSVPDAITSAGARRFGAVERAWINDTISRQIHSGADVGRFPLIVTTRDSTPRVLAYTVMPTSWGDTLVYGAEYDRAGFVELLSYAMSGRDLLPATFTRGRPVTELIELQVTDARGRRLYESSPVRRWALDDTASLGAPFGTMHVRAQIRRSQADALVIGGLPRSRLPFLLALLAIAAALSFVAIGQIRRDGELTRMRADFVASISHELRTPLAQMRLYLETLRLGRFTTDAQREWSLDNVERETTRLSHLVERVLRFSRTTRPIPDAREPVDVGAETMRIVQEFRPLADARGVTLDARVEPTPMAALQADALRHVVLNLLDNAVKYGPRGQTVRLRVVAVGNEVRIEVRDEGAGIAAEDRARIWQPYTRGGSAGHTAGSGIGLSIVREVAVLHGGRAWVDESLPGTTGARIVVAFPALSVATAGVAAGAAASDAQHPSDDLPTGVPVVARG
jgi:signal transduction histidine kinase